MKINNKINTLFINIRKLLNHDYIQLIKENLNQNQISYISFYDRFCKSNPAYSAYFNYMEKNQNVGLVGCLPTCTSKGTIPFWNTVTDHEDIITCLLHHDIFPPTTVFIRYTVFQKSGGIDHLLANGFYGLWLSIARESEIVRLTESYFWDHDFRPQEVDNKLRVSFIQELQKKGVNVLPLLRKACTWFFEDDWLYAQYENRIGSEEIDLFLQLLVTKSIDSCDRLMSNYFHNRTVYQLLGLFRAYLEYETYGRIGNLDNCRCIIKIQMPNWKTPISLSKKMVSVIMPTFNRADTISDSISSVLNQSYEDLELIIVNDGGNAEELNVQIDKFNDDRIRLINAEHQGLSEALNRGINESSGYYIAYLDDDDIYYPNHLEIGISKIKASEFDLVYTKCRLALGEYRGGTFHKIKDLGVSTKSFDELSFRRECYISTLNVIHKRSVIEKVGMFNKDLTWSMDWDLWNRISLNGKIGHINKITGEYRYNGKNMTMLNRHQGIVLMNLERIYLSYGGGYLLQALDYLEKQDLQNVNISLSRIYQETLGISDVAGEDFLGNILNSNISKEEKIKIINSLNTIITKKHLIKMLANRPLKKWRITDFDLFPMTWNMAVVFMFIKARMRSDFIRMKINSLSNKSFSVI